MHTIPPAPAWGRLGKFSVAARSEVRRKSISGDSGDGTSLVQNLRTESQPYGRKSESAMLEEQSNFELREKKNVAQYILSILFL